MMGVSGSTVGCSSIGVLVGAANVVGATNVGRAVGSIWGIKTEQAIIKNSAKIAMNVRREDGFFILVASSADLYLIQFYWICGISRGNFPVDSQRVSLFSSVNSMDRVCVNYISVTGNKLKSDLRFRCRD